MTEELTYIKTSFSFIGREEKQKLLEHSNLNDRELELLSMRLVHGNTLKECADRLNIEENSVNKAQRKAVKKLYAFLINQ